MSLSRMDYVQCFVCNKLMSNMTEMFMHPEAGGIICAVCYEIVKLKKVLTSENGIYEVTTIGTDSVPFKQQEKFEYENI